MIIYVHKLAGEPEPLSDERMLESVSAPAEVDHQYIVQRDAPREELRVDGYHTSLATHVELLAHVDDFALEHGGVAGHGLRS